MFTILDKIPLHESQATKGQSIHGSQSVQSGGLSPTGFVPAAPEQSSHAWQRSNKGTKPA